MAGKKQQLKAKEAGKIDSTEPNDQTQQPKKALTKQAAPQGRRSAKSDSKELAAVLQRKALAGDSESIKLLFTIDNNRAKSAKSGPKKRNGLTSAQRLALAPPWRGDPEQDFSPVQEPQPKLA